MDQFRLQFRDHPAGPVRQSWEEAAQDAVAAGLAHWVHEIPRAAISWTGPGPASIVRLSTQLRGTRDASRRNACDCLGQLAEHRASAA